MTHPDSEGPVDAGRGGPRAPEVLTSTRNPRVRAAKALQRGRGRADAGAVLLEGRRLVDAAVIHGVPLVDVFVTDEDDPLRHVPLAEPSTSAAVVSEQVLGAVATTQHPQGVVAVARWRPFLSCGELLTSRSEGARVVVLDRVADPGNVGTLLRTAAAFGFEGAVMLRGSCDPTGPKCLRATAGAAFGLDLAVGVEPSELSATAGGWDLIGASRHGGLAPDRVECPGRCLLVVGSEAHGLSPEVAEALDRFVTIPMSEGVESLNTAVAAGVLMAHLSTV